MPRLATKFRVSATTTKTAAPSNSAFMLSTIFTGDLDNRIFRDVRWVNRGQLPEFDFLDADKELVRDLAAGKIV